MKRFSLYAILLLFLFPSCSKKTGASVTVVKPTYHHRWYDRKKDKRVKRTKFVKVKN